MAFSLNDVTKDVTKRGSCTVIYGPGSVGKTTLMAEAIKAKNGLVISGEDGMRDDNTQGIARTPVVDSWETFQEILRALITEKHEYTTIAIDTLDAIVDKLDSYVVKTYYGGDEKKANAYKAKYEEYVLEFSKVLSAFSILQKKGVTIIPVVHAMISKMKDPSSEEYQRWVLNLPGGVKTSLADALFNYADNVLFATFNVTVKDGKGAGAQRVLNTEWNAAYDAKNRAPGVPLTISLDYATASKFGLI
jgi:AAA+ ATPase superfamily predicted ATPase